jgi:hypothetical protein
VKHLKRWTVANLIRTDVRDRGVPWFVLMMRHRTMPADLNVTVAHRISVALVGLLLVLLGVGLAAALFGHARTPMRVGVLLVAIAGVAALLIALNHEFYRFYLRKRGVWFALGTIPLHWLYYAYCGVSVILGLATVYRERFTQRVPVGPPPAG